MLLNGFSRFFVDSGTRYWSRDKLEAVFRSAKVGETLDSPFIQSVLADLESEGYIKRIYDDQRYLEVFNIDQIDMNKKKTT